MNDDSIDLSEHRLALLALQLLEQDDSSMSEVLSDDDLIALYAGNLNAEERYNALRCIAHDRNTYQRWLSLVESTHTVDGYFDLLAEHTAAGEQQDLTEVTSSSPSNKLPFWTTLKENVQRWLKPLSYSAGALVTATVAFILVSPGTPDYQKQLDQLYNDYGQESKALYQASDSLPTRAAGQWPKDVQVPAYTAVQAALAKGIQAGLQSFGSSVSISGVKIAAQMSTDQAPLAVADQNALASLGRLVALTYSRCQNNEREQGDFYQRAAPVYLQLSRELSAANYSELNVMGAIHEQRDGSEKTISQEEMCMLTVNAINQFKG